MTPNKKWLFSHPRSSLLLISVSESLLLTPGIQHRTTFFSFQLVILLTLTLVSVSMLKCWSSLYMQPPFIYKRIQHWKCKGKMFISRSWELWCNNKGQITCVINLAFCMSITISHLDIWLMAKSYKGMLLCSYFNVLGSASRTQIPADIYSNAEWLFYHFKWFKPMKRHCICLPNSPLKWKPLKVSSPLVSITEYERYTLLGLLRIINH